MDKKTFMVVIIIVIALFQGHRPCKDPNPKPKNKQNKKQTNKNQKQEIFVGCEVEPEAVPKDEPKAEQKWIVEVFVFFFVQAILDQYRFWASRQFAIFATMPSAMKAVSKTVVVVVEVWKLKQSYKIEKI